MWLVEKNNMTCLKYIGIIERKKHYYIKKRVIIFKNIIEKSEYFKKIFVPL